MKNVLGSNLFIASSMMEYLRSDLAKKTELDEILPKEPARGFRNWRQRGVRWKRDEPFLREVLGHLQAVKVAWRNPTMHIVNVYTLEQAEEIFNAVRGFMRHLATRLSE